MTVPTSSHRPVAAQRHRAGLRVDEHDAEVDGRRIGAVGRVEERGLLQPDLQIGGAVAGMVGGVGHGRERELAVRALDRELAIGEVEVLGRALHHVRRQPLGLGHDAVGGSVDRHAGGRQRARAPGADAHGHAVGIALHQVDMVDVAAEAVGGDLAPGSLVTLAVAVAAGEHGDAPVRVHAHAGDVIAADLGAEVVHHLDRAGARPCRRRRRCRYPSTGLAT